MLEGFEEIGKEVGEGLGESGLNNPRSFVVRSEVGEGEKLGEKGEGVCVDASLNRSVPSGRVDNVRTSSLQNSESARDCGKEKVESSDGLTNKGFGGDRLSINEGERSRSSIQ